jgi:hypothetical protein
VTTAADSPQVQERIAAARAVFARHPDWPASTLAMMLVEQLDPGTTVWVRGEAVRYWRVAWRRGTARRGRHMAVYTKPGEARRPDGTATRYVVDPAQVSLTPPATS